MVAPLTANIPPWFLAGAALWLLLCTWMGWRRGVVRQFISLLALGASTVAAFYAGPWIAPLIPAVGFPAFMRPAVAGMLVGSSVWFLITIVSGILFRKTDEQGIGLVRFVYGVLGAAFGLAFGVAVLGIALWGTRLAGTFAEGLAAGTRSVATRKLSPFHSGDSGTLASLKEALDQGGVSDLLSRVDPLPSEWYARLGKIGRVVSDADATERFLSAPGIEQISKNPKLLALKTDPELQDALHSGNLAALLQNPKLQAAASDTQLMTALRSIDIDKALDQAISPPEKPRNHR